MNSKNSCKKNMPLKLDHNHNIKWMRFLFTPSIFFFFHPLKKLTPTVTQNPMVIFMPKFRTIKYNGRVCSNSIPAIQGLITALLSQSISIVHYPLCQHIKILPAKLSHLVPNQNLPCSPICRAATTIRLIPSLLHTHTKLSCP